MTRDEAKMALTGVKTILPKPQECTIKLEAKVSTIYEIVDKIFDDFDKMNCNNCKYLDGTNRCSNAQSPWFKEPVCDIDEDPSVLCCKFFEEPQNA